MKLRDYYDYELKKALSIFFMKFGGEYTLATSLYPLSNLSIFFMKFTTIILRLAELINDIFQYSSWNSWGDFYTVICATCLASFNILHEILINENINRKHCVTSKLSIFFMKFNASSSSSRTRNPKSFNILHEIPWNSYWTALQVCVYL